MSIFKSDIGISNNLLPLDTTGSGAALEAYDYVIDAITETNITTSFVTNTTEELEKAQEQAASSINPRRLLYGTVRTAGAIVFHNILDATGYPQLQRIHAFSDGEVHIFSNPYLNGRLARPNVDTWMQGTFDNDVFKGLINQNIANTNLNHPSEWDANFDMSNIACVYTVNSLNPDVYGSALPNITYKVSGKNLYDPRKDSTSGSILYDSSLGVSTHRIDNTTTWQYSTNSALCLLDYMMNNVVGMGEPFSKFDEQSLRDALDICDENITDSNNQPRKKYTCNGTIFANKTHRENIKQILTTMNGKLIYSGGKYHIKPYAYCGKPEADSPSPHPTVVDESMIVGDISYTAKQGLRSTYNRVKGKFNSEHDNYVVTDYPVQFSSADSDGLTYDDKDGQTLYLEYNLPLTTNVEDAQRLARLMMLRSRMQATVQFTTNMKGLTYKVGDFITFSNNILGFPSNAPKEFEIVDYKIINNIGTGIQVEITAKETVQPIYNWTASDAIDYLGDETIDDWDGFLPLPQNVTLTESLDVSDPNNPRSVARVAFDAADTERLKHYEITFFDAIDGSIKHVFTTKNNISNYDNEIIHTHPLRVRVKTVSIRDLASVAVVATGAIFLRQYENLSYPPLPYPSSDLSAPTDAEFIAYFGRPPQKNDVILAYIEQDGIILDSKQYYYEPDIRHDADLGDVLTSSQGNPLTHRHTFLLPQSLWNNSVTWTFSISNYSSSVASYTTFQNLQTETTNQGGRFEMDFTFYQSDFTGTNLPWFEQGDLTVTATWATGSVTWSTQNDYHAKITLFALN